MAVLVCPHCRNDGTPVYEGVSRVSSLVPFLISLGFPLFLVVMKGVFRWGYGFWVEFVEGSFQLRKRKVGPLFRCSGEAFSFESVAGLHAIGHDGVYFFHVQVGTLLSV